MGIAIAKGIDPARAIALVTTLLALASGVAACDRRGKIAPLRDALARGDAARVASAVEGAPSCASAPGTRASDECLALTATWFQSKTGFHADAPDQASAATAALAIARDARGDAMPAPEAWTYVITSGEGPGADALRLAMTARMTTAAPSLARALDTEADARAVMRAVGESVAGACATYALLGAGSDDRALPPELRADHSSCVQHDLDRASGPREHGRYGFGLWRGAEGALASWKDAVSALHAGATKADPGVRAVLASRLATIDAALAQITLKKLPPPPDLSQFMGDGHERRDAGAPQTASPGASP